MACAATSFTLKEMFPSMITESLCSYLLPSKITSPPGAPKISRSLSPTFSITITTRIRPTVLGRRAVGVAGGCPWKEFPTRPSGV